jgi:hypothetical protein
MSSIKLIDDNRGVANQIAPHFFGLLFIYLYFSGEPASKHTDL